MVPLEHHHLVPSQEVVPHPQSVPPDLEVAAQSSQHLLLLLSIPWSTTPMEPPHTSLGHPRLGSVTTCPRALPIALPPSGKWISSKSPPASAGGACDGPAPGSSKRCLLALSHHQQASPQHPPASSLSYPRLSPRRSHQPLMSGALTNSTSRPQGPTSAHTKNK
jgi:hypothetical protein